MAALLLLLAILPANIARAADSTAPVVSSFSALGDGSYGPGDTFSYSFVASDADSGIDFIRFAFYTPIRGHLEQRDFDGSPLTMAVGDTWATGAYELRYVEAVDKAGISTHYWRDGSATTYPSGASGPTAHSLDLSSGDFTVGGTSNDTSAPILDSFAQQGDAAYSTGETVGFSYAAHDDVAGVDYVRFILRTPIDGQLEITDHDAVSPAQYVLPSHLAHGTYSLKAIQVADMAGYIRTYFREGHVILHPSNVDGPQGHSFDFSRGDFTVGTGAAPSPTPTPSTSVTPSPSPTQGPEYPQSTIVEVVRPWGPSGKLRAGFSSSKTVRGDCWTGSLTSQQRSAWRCMSGNLIMDPCFKGRNERLACVRYPWRKRVELFKLKKPLPRRHANEGIENQASPFGIELSNGERCVLGGGTSVEVDGVYMRWYCSNGAAGGVDPEASPWTAFYSPDYESGESVTIRKVWF